MTSGKYTSKPDLSLITEAQLCVKLLDEFPFDTNGNENSTNEDKVQIIEIADEEKYHQFQEILKLSIETNDYVQAFKILSEARDFVTASYLSEKSYRDLEVHFQINLANKLNDLGFIDVDKKMISTTFWAISSSGNLTLKGPPGVGKSFFSKTILPELWICDGQKPHVITIQPDRNMEISSLVADRGIRKGDTIVEEGQIADAIHFANNGRRVILILEEINQWPPKVLKDLNDFLEERKLERKIAGKLIKLESSKENLFVIANYNPEGYTLGEDDTGSVSSRFIFCDLPFPSKKDLEKIIEMNVTDREFKRLSVGDEIQKTPNPIFLQCMSDICYSLRSSIEAGELGPLAMPIGTRHIINFSRVLINHNPIADAVYKTLVDPILEKYVREGPLTNIESQDYDEYIRTIFKTIKQILGTINPVDEKDLSSLQMGLMLSITELFQTKGMSPYQIRIRPFNPENPPPTQLDPSNPKDNQSESRLEIVPQQEEEPCDGCPFMKM